MNWIPLAIPWVLNNWIYSTFNRTAVITDYDDDITSLNTAYWWMYMQDGNYAAARRMIADSLRLAMLMQADERGDSIGLTIWSLEHISRAFCIDMEKPSLPVEEFRELLAVMQETEERFFTRDYLSKQIAGKYLARRKDKVRAMSSASSWRGKVYGWDLVSCDNEASHDEFIPKDFLSNRYYATIRLPWGGQNREPIQITRYDRVLATSIRAMWNKIHCARNLKDFDRQVRQVIEESKAGYASIRLAKYGAGSAHYLLAETYLRLARLGLLWRLDPQGTLALRDGDIAGNPNHPWRDPFTNEAFRINKTATQTLIYSLGPGLVDQHGMVEYYPKILGYRKHIAGKRDGNLVIRLPRG